MQDMAKQQQVENGQFKAGAFKEIEKMMEVLLVGHGIKASPHIKSRIKVLKKQFQIVQELRGLSGAGWNDELKCVNIEDSSFSEHVQVIGHAFLLCNEFICSYSLIGSSCVISESFLL
ncbi:hypothetical protein LINPERHAP2_LOCUS23374 [Linum perenne]